MPDSPDARLVTARRRKFERRITIWAFVLTLALTFFAWRVYKDERSREHQAQAAATQAQIACQRALLFAPALGAYFARVHALTAPQVKAYIGLLPSHC